MIRLLIGFYFFVYHLFPLLGKIPEGEISKKKKDIRASKLPFKKSRELFSNNMLKS